MINARLNLAQPVVAAMLRDDRATHALGMVLIRLEAGTCYVEMTIREDMLNGHGTCHGGILFSLADTAFGIACNRSIFSGPQLWVIRFAPLSSNGLSLAVSGCTMFRSSINAIRRLRCSAENPVA